MKKALDKLSNTDIKGADEESTMIDFQALKETVLNERQAKADADAALAQELSADKVVASFTDVDALFAFLND